LKECISVIGTLRNVIDPDSQARKKQNYEQMLQHGKKLEDEYGQKILDSREAQERQEILEIERRSGGRNKLLINQDKSFLQIFRNVLVVMFL
jgi:hypothetical protein